MTQQQLARDSWEVSPSELWKNLYIFACMSWLHWLKKKQWQKLEISNVLIEWRLLRQITVRKNCNEKSIYFEYSLLTSSIDIYCTSFNNDLGFQNREVPSSTLTAQQKNTHYLIMILYIFFSNINHTYTCIFIYYTRKLLRSLWH